MASPEIEEMQNEEVEALISIYEGDDNFKQISPKVYQYKVRIPSPHPDQVNKTPSLPGPTVRRRE